MKETKTSMVTIYNHLNNEIERTNEMEVYSPEKGVFLVSTGLDQNLNTEYLPVWENSKSMEIDDVSDFILFTESDFGVF